MKTIKVEWKDEDKSLNGVVTFKKLSFGEKNQLEEEATEAKVVAGQPVVRVSVAKLKEVSLVKGIFTWDLMDEKAQKIPLNADTIRNLPAEIGEMLLEEFTAYNQSTQKKNS